MAKLNPWIYKYGYLIKIKSNEISWDDEKLYANVKYKVYPVWKYALSVIVLLLFYFIYTIFY